MKASALDLKRRTDVYYEFYIFSENTHSKYPTVKLTIIMIIIVFHILSVTCHPLLNVCGVLRPPILGINYN